MNYVVYDPETGQIRGVLTVTNLAQAIPDNAYLLEITEEQANARPEIHMRVDVVNKILVSKQ